MIRTEKQTEQLDYLRRAIEHAPREPRGPMAPDLRGWWADGWYVCARCAARIMERGCHLPAPATPVWTNQDSYGRCCLCEK